MYRETREYMVVKGNKVYLPHIYMSNVNEDIEITFCSEDSEASGKQTKSQVLLTIAELDELERMIENVRYRACKELESMNSKGGDDG